MNVSGASEHPDVIWRLVEDTAHLKAEQKSIKDDVASISEELATWREWIKRGAILVLLWAGASGAALSSDHAAETLASLLRSFIER